MRRVQGWCGVGKHFHRQTDQRADEQDGQSQSFEDVATPPRSCLGIPRRLCVFSKQTHRSKNTQLKTIRAKKGTKGFQIVWRKRLHFTHVQRLTWLCCSLTTSEGLERCAASWTPHTILFIANHNYLWYGESAIWRPHKTLFVIFVREYVQKKDMLLKKPLAYDWPCKMIFGRDALGHRKKELKKSGILSQ